MRVFVAGAAGVVGRQLVPMLIEAGHEVVGTSRSPARARWLESVGARGIVLDAFDAEAVVASVEAAGPDAIVHQLTDLAAGYDPAQLARNASLRRDGTRNLVAGALATGVRRLVAQSAAWLYADGPLPHDEAHPLRAPTGEPVDVTLRGVLDLEAAVGAAGLDGVLLRYGYLYGPGTGSERDATPLPRVSVEGAARAAVLAVDRGPAGVYNIVDDAGLVSNRRARDLLGWSP